MNTEFLESLIKKEDVVKQALTKLYQGVRATNEFLGLKNSPELQSTYYKLRVEEVGELFTAIENKDKVEFLDAVVDGLVVVGYEEYLKEYRATEKLISICESDIVNSCNSLFNLYEQESQYSNTLYHLENIFNVLNVDHMRAVEEVLDSNMSKFPTVDEFGNSPFWSVVEYKCNKNVKLRELIEYQIGDILKQGRYIDVFHELRYDESVGEDRIIFWARKEKQKDGSIKEFPAPKYVKPFTFKEPDFASCWRT